MALTPTLNELTFSVLNTVRARTNISELISLEQIKFLVKSVRAQLIKQDANKGYTPDSYIIQDLGCVALTQVDPAECCDVQVGCTILRTDKPIPSVIELHHQQLLTRVGSVDKTQPSFDFIPYERVPYEQYNKFTRNRIKAYLMNNGGYMYFIVPNDKTKLLKYVNIQGVFEDPEQVAVFSPCSGSLASACYTDDTPFPVKEWMVPTIIEMVVKLFIRPEAAAATDSTSNNKLDTEPPLAAQQV